MSPSLKLKQNANARVLHGHPWVFANEVEALLSESANGEVVDCRDRAGRFLGSGIYNGHSQIVWRRLSRQRVELDEAFLGAAIRRAVGARGQAPFARLVWSESDDLPGLVADRFGPVVVLQVQTLAMEKRSELIAGLLAGAAGAEELIFRNDSNLRRLEGLPQEIRTRSGRDWQARWMEIDGIQYWLDLQRGQKTGFYLDQREQHRRVAAHVGRLAAMNRQPRVLDAFCNQGSFALNAARAGASEVLAIDSAGDAIQSARMNAERNALAVRFEVANVFDWFTEHRDRPAEWDIIVLDPPPFAKGKSALPNALRGYRELNLRAMRALKPGGLLATYACSHHVRDADFRTMLGEAAGDAKRRVRVVEWCHQPADHPVIATMPESEYLRGYLLEVE